MDFNKSYNRGDFIRFLEKKFLPDDFQSIEKNISGTIEFTPKFASSVTWIGTCKSLDLEVFEIEHTSTHDARIGISRDAFQIMLNNSNCNRALVAFIPKDKERQQYRFSFLQIEAEQKDNSARIQRNYSNPRRYSYLLGEGVGGHTPNKFLLERGRVKKDDNGKDLIDRFSVEILTKQFYKELYGWYQWATSEITFPDNAETADDEHEQINTKVIRLITRLMFVWFIKQSNLIPEKIFNEDDLKNILKDFDPTSKTSGNYYNAILQNLFFATLNKEGNQRRFARSATKDAKTFYRYAELFCKSESEVINFFSEIPFLNGGLFECLDKTKTIDGIEKAYNYDGFSRNNKTFANGRYRNRAFVPNTLFFKSEEGLLSIFRRYNFTIEENTPQEQQMALDPELLGKVFENLLGAYNPETKETVRKQSGSFYTPREIVDYMVDEALIAYLGDTEIIRVLFREEGLPEELRNNQEEQERICNKLKEVKILDPACGSGAFPMGILNRIVNLLQKLSGKNDETIYNEKLQIIENCIFGVDIQNIATQISKLRFFISLICHCRKDRNKENNFGIPTLPNLETNFVSADSLIGIKQQDTGRLDLNDGELKLMWNRLQDIRHDYFKAKSSDEKIGLRKKDEWLRSEIEQYILRQIEKPDYDRIAELEKEIEKLQKERQPFLQPNMVNDTSRNQQTSLLEDGNPKFLFQKDANEPKRKELTRRIKVIKEQITKEKNKQKLPEFENTIRQLSTWNPYDQNMVSSFFDPEWMFGIRDGFDIVIGNPPYIQLEKNRGKLSKLYKPCGYKFLEKQNNGDIYCLFYERGWQLLKPNGKLCYITSNKWMRTKYGEAIRKFFVEYTNPEKLINFAGVKVFESAEVDINILLFTKWEEEKHGENHHKTICAITNKNNKNGIKNLSVFVQQNASECKFKNSDSWVILSPVEQRIKEKIEAVGTPLKDWDINIYRGVLTGCNEAFIISGSKRQEILDNCIDEEERQKTAEVIRPILRGRDINRYKYNKRAGLWLINTHNGIKEKNIPKIDIKDYPAIKAHLDSFWEKIEKRADKGDTPYNLRNCAYMEDFLKPKIVWKRVGSILRFCYDENDYTVLDSCCFAIGNHIKYLVTVLNSKMGNYLLKDAQKDWLISV